MQNRSFARYARAVLGYNLFVVLWGAYVRATGSGAGCGRHWPLCSGGVVPRSAQAETVIELGHRLTSGLALLAPVWLQLVHLLLADLLWIALVLLAAAALADSPRRSEPRDRHRAPAASAA